MIQSMNSVSKVLIIIGCVLIVAGVIWHFSDGKIPLGRLPGDFRYETENTKIYFPFTTGILISLIVSLAAYLFDKFR